LLKQKIAACGSSGHLCVVYDAASALRRSELARDLLVVKNKRSQPQQLLQPIFVIFIVSSSGDTDAGARLA